MGLPQIIANAHRSQLRAHGVDVVYRSATAGDVEVRALHKQSFAKMVEESGAYLTTVADDWHIAAASLVDDDGREITPRAGDAVFLVESSGLVTQFDVLAWADEPARAFADVTRQIHNVHSKQVQQFVAGQLLSESGAPLLFESGAPLISESVVTV